MRNKVLAFFLPLISYLPTVVVEPADTVGKSFMLDDVSVVAVGPRRILKAEADGRLQIDGQLLSEMPTLMGIHNPIALVSSLPAVSTPNDLQAGLSIRGGNPGDNYFTVDGARVVNPLHMLGFFSTFNPSFYTGYRFRADRIPATETSFMGGLFDARTSQQPDSTLQGAVTVGIIESNLGIRIPIRPSKISLAAGFRNSYLNLFFPDILTLGSSRLKYGYTDLNLGLTYTPTAHDLLKISALYSQDDMSTIVLTNGQKDGSFGWTNLATSAVWTHRNMTTTVAYTQFTNKFYLTEGARVLDLPSSLRQGTASWAWQTDKHWKVMADAHIRHSSGQHNRSLGPRPDGLGHVGAEVNLSADYNLNLHCGLSLDAGLRLALYTCNGYRTALPQPRLDVRYSLNDAFNPFISYSRTAQFEILVQESSGGMPVDFRINADNNFKPRIADNFNAGISGTIPGLIIRYNIEGYYRRFARTGEFLGSILDLSNAGYSPLDDYAQGKGYGTGLSVMAMRQFGRVRGRLSYNLGKSRVLIPRIGPDYVPSSNDRLHDLNVSLTWEPLRGLTVTGSFTHATGTPFTRAKYGYLLGDNLICEYFPHNSSRLPSYNRLDLGLGYQFKKRNRFSHAINISVYNALASKNILFQYTSYSVAGGIVLKESTMKSVIPSVAYTLSF